ncbi:MAG: VCBS repeat-containing protein [Puia sp.]
MGLFSKLYLFSTVVIITACSKTKTLFTLVDPSQTHIDFANTLEETAERNVMTYEYYYNGGGVAAADFNNDGLCDLYFTGNNVQNKLYLNKGGLKFEDVTNLAGVQGRSDWKTGVTVADVNGDGWLDIYVSYSGPVKKEQLYDELYINNGCKKGGIPTFTEMAGKYGLDAPYTFSTQSVFFDFDGDGDLDMFQCNHAIHYFSPFYNTSNIRKKRHPQFSNRLYRNDDGVFKDVSEQSGIFGGGLNFSLSACISDINNDGWPDIYVTNDFEEQDYLYLNTGKGTFADVTKQSTGHLSRFSMGSDIADFNNDLLPDIMVVDMLPTTLERQKLLKGPDDFDKYNMMIDSGFQHQNMRNTLQLNQGNTSEGIPLFSEIGQMAGMYNTDWSWSALFADLDNDGYKDIFITNGFLRDFTNLDFLKYTYQDALEKSKRENAPLEIFDLIKTMPSTKLANFVFRNNKDLTFSDYTKTWGLDKPILSFGAVYVDLDNDGDLDLVTNNTNEKASIWENHANELLKNNYIKVKLHGKGKNTYAVGAKVYVFSDNTQQVQEMNPTRGFQSCVDYVLNFGLGAESRNINLKIIWPDGTVSLISNAAVNSLVEVDQVTTSKLAQDSNMLKKENLFQFKTPKKFSIDDKIGEKGKLFENYTRQSGVRWSQHENNIVDFRTAPLMPYQVSKSGPFLSEADVNNDGLEDFFVGGTKGFEGAIFIQRPDHTFFSPKGQPFGKDKAFEDEGSVFFDANGDHEPDLYVVSGGYTGSPNTPEFLDRLYINDGHGTFKKADQDALPKEFANGSCVKAADIDRDGDMDLFVGGGVLPGKFPFSEPSRILRNDMDRKTNKLKFLDVTKDINEKLQSIGIVTDAVWTDLDNDGWPDLVVVGEWMPIHIFMNRNGKLEELADTTLNQTDGLWSKILAADFDNDGDIDLVIGNAGMNGQWKPTTAEPMTMYVDDFDNNGTIDPIICVRQGEKDYPVASFDEMIRQIPSIQKKFTHYKEYSKASIDDIFSPAQLDHAKKMKLETLQSVYLENLGNGKFKMSPLPWEAQISKVNGILSGDYNHDSHLDILLSGNYFDYKVQYGRADASYGLLLAGNGKGKFTPMNGIRTGLYANGDIRDMIELKSKGSDLIIFGKNNDSIQVVRVCK